MTKLTVAKFLLCFSIFIICISVAKGENYVSKIFPPKEMLEKDCGEGKKYIGKTQDKDGTYRIYFSYTTERTAGVYQVRFMELLIYKLDNDIWIIKYPTSSDDETRVHILQK